MADLMQSQLIDPGYMNLGRWQHISQTYREIGALPEDFDVTPMLYFPNSADDLKKLKLTLYYAAAGLLLLILILMVLFRFYRKAHINEAKLNTIFNYAPLSLIVLDEKNRVQNWNAEAEKTFLWRAKDILGENILAIVPPACHAEVEEVFTSVHKNDSILQHENLNIKKDGGEILCEWLNAPFKDDRNHSSFIICMARDITEQKRLEQQLENAAHYDNLTALPNRALILERLKQSLAAAARHKTRLALLFLDLNDFKAINDTMGHEAGDILLQTVAQRLPQAIRENDYAGRLGGDEFLVILQDIGSLENAQKMADKLHDIICLPCELKGQTVCIRASIGISLYPDDATEINALIRHADNGMYLAKQAGHSSKPTA